jgi:hypothetical protein
MMSGFDQDGCFPQMLFFLFLGLVACTLATGSWVLWPVAGAAILTVIWVTGYRGR